VMISGGEIFKSLLLPQLISHNADESLPTNELRDVTDY
jgi:hypothetical protein